MTGESEKCSGTFCYCLMKSAELVHIQRLLLFVLLGMKQEQHRVSRRTNKMWARAGERVVTSPSNKVLMFYNNSSGLEGKWAGIQPATQCNWAQDPLLPGFHLERQVWNPRAVFTRTLRFHQTHSKASHTSLWKTSSLFCFLWAKRKKEVNSDSNRRTREMLKENQGHMF